MEFFAGKNECGDLVQVLVCSRITVLALNSTATVCLTGTVQNSKDVRYIVVLVLDTLHEDSMCTCDSICRLVDSCLTCVALC
jgi:hypothetical protein